MPTLLGSSMSHRSPRLETGYWVSHDRGRLRWYRFHAFALMVKGHFDDTYARSSSNRTVQDGRMPIPAQCSEPFVPREFESEEHVIAAIERAHTKLGFEHPCAKMATDHPQKFGDLSAFLVGQLQQNRDVLSTMEHALERKFICSANGTRVFLWVEDDVTICPGAEEHIAEIASWLSGLEPRARPVYVRLSMGFIGIMVRSSACARCLGVPFARSSARLARGFVGAQRCPTTCAAPC